MSKKGIALGVVVSLIAGVVFLVIAIFLILQAGLLATVKEQLAVMVCTFSTYSRNMFLNTIWTFVSGLLVAITIMSLISGASAGPGALKYLISTATLKSAVKMIATTGLKAAGIGLMVFLSFDLIFILAVTAGIFPKIPLMCPATTINVGLHDKPVGVEDFVNTIGSRTMDCWSMMGSGNANPLWGLDPPNPRICFTLEVHLDESTNMKNVGGMIYNKFNNSWPFGGCNNMNLYLYCGRDYKGNNIDNWDCNIQDNRIFILFRDKHDYDYISYDSSVCGGAINVGNFKDKDNVVICVESI